MRLRLSAPEQANEEQTQNKRGVNLAHSVQMQANVKVSDGRQPPTTFDLSLSESAASRSLHRRVGRRHLMLLDSRRV
jgi:hypothetical protein